MSDTERNYLRDLVFRLREEARDAATANDDFGRGRAFAIAEVLSIMQNQAKAFQMPVDDILLDGFDPFEFLDAARSAAEPPSAGG